MLTKIKDRIVRRLFPRPAPRTKEDHEMAYWRWKLAQEKEIENGYYEHFYTAHFGLDRAFYDGNVLVDVGCFSVGGLASDFGLFPGNPDYWILRHESVSWWVDPMMVPMGGFGVYHRYSGSFRWTRLTPDYLDQYRTTKEIA